MIQISWFHSIWFSSNFHPTLAAYIGYIHIKQSILYNYRNVFFFEHWKNTFCGKDKKKRLLFKINHITVWGGEGGLLHQRSSTLFLGTHYPEEFSYNHNQTHLKRQSSSSRLAWKLQAVCWSRLEINFPGEWVPRSRVEDLCFTWQSKIVYL